MDEKLDIIISEISKINTNINKINSNIGVIYSDISKIYLKIDKIDSNLEELFEVNRFTGNFFQGHEDRIAILENSR